MRRLFSVLVLLVCLGMCLFVPAQNNQTKPKSDQDQSVQLKTELIEIHAVVTDKHGNPIKNLRKEDFELSENKVTQDIGFFTIENIVGSPANASGNTGTNPAPSAPRPMIPTGKTPGRLIVLFVDNLNLSVHSFIRVKRFLTKFVDEQLTDRDVVALITSAGSLGVLEQFTQDRQILKYAIDRLNPGPTLSESMFTPYIAGLVTAGE